MTQLPPLSIPQTDPPRPPGETLPTMYDLPSENLEEPGLPDEFHDLQPQLLSWTLKLTGYTPDNCFSASDLNLYYDGKHPLWYKRPDWFLVVDVPRLYEGRELRRSYVVWQEAKPPDVVVEFLSPGTEEEDLGRFYDESAHILDEASTLRATTSQASASGSMQETGKLNQREKPPAKFEVYERNLRVPHYIVYSRYTQRLRYFKLEGGLYKEQSLQSDQPEIWLEDLGIGLGVWSGTFAGVPSAWLRWCDSEGNWLLTDTEQERLTREQIQQLAEQERLAKEQAQRQLRQAARNLLATGMSSVQVAQILGLPETEIQAMSSPDQ